MIKEERGWKTLLFGFLTMITTVMIKNGWLPEGSDEAANQIIEGIAVVLDGIFAMATVYGSRDAKAKILIELKKKSDE